MSRQITLGDIYYITNVPITVEVDGEVYIKDDEVPSETDMGLIVKSIDAGEYNIHIEC